MPDRRVFKINLKDSEVILSIVFKFHCVRIDLVSQQMFVVYCYVLTLLFYSYLDEIC